MEISEMVVLADAFHLEEARSTFRETPLSVQEWPESLPEGGRLLKRLYEERRQGFVLYGGDDLVSRVVTAYWRRSELGADPLNLWPLAAGEAFVAGHRGEATAPARALRWVRRGVGDWQRTRVGTLKVTASTQSAAWYGFTFGAGWVYRAIEARRRSRGGAGNFVAAFGRLATDTLREDEGIPIALRVAIDHHPRENTTGSLVVSTLAQTHFGLRADGGAATLWEPLSTSDLMRSAVTPGVLAPSNQRGRPFESVHLDTPHGWLLDGRLHGGDEPGVVQVVPGPTVTLMRPGRSLGSKIGGLLSGRR